MPRPTVTRNAPAANRQPARSILPKWLLTIGAGVGLAIAYFYNRTTVPQLVFEPEKGLEALDTNGILARIRDLKINHLDIKLSNSQAAIGEKIFFETTSKPLPAKVEEKLKKIILSSSSEAGLARILHNPYFTISVVNKKTLQEFKNNHGEDHSTLGSYDPLNNEIFIIEDVVTEPFTPEKIEFLTQIIKNELSHALAHSTKVAKTTKSYKVAEAEKTVAKMQDLYLPWTSKDEFLTVQSAYNQYKERVAYFKTLSDTPHKELTSEQMKELNDFTRIIKKYFKPHTLNSLANSSTSKNKTLKKSVRNMFFETRREKIMESNYPKELDHQSLLAERISDFDQLHPEVQKFLAPSLCKALDKVHAFPAGMYCSRFSS